MDLALQLLVVGLSQAAIYSMVATGFGLVLAVSHIFHFAHAAIFALAGFLAYAFIMQLGLPFWLGFVLTAILTVAAGLLIQLYIYAPLKRRNSGTFALVLASIGMQFAIENLIALGWGTGGRYLENPFGGVFYQIGTVIISLTDIVTLTVAIAGFGATMLFLKATRIGRAMMAYADNPTMAEVVGINPTLVSAVAISIASLLVVPAAIATGWYSSLVPTMGLTPLLYAVAAVVVGGIGSTVGAFLGAFMLGLLAAMISLQLPAFWSDTIAFLIMMVVVVWRPSGLLGNIGAARAAR
ncbi:branched-chain amino acid ABC transporter permease [Aquibium sp. LZ166]|uniref:Branched-chain amino acid ABC transporter permease n=1 Tax=Aquibium pacificus TaxID=3153579 RepID=A0ABV3SPC3_9HYPH